MKTLQKRAMMLKAIRQFFDLKGYLEVETPLRIPVAIPETHIFPFESEGWVLQSSPEICMKRLMARGYDRLFQICKCFRKDERGDRHLTELTMLEWYRKDFTYIELMDECQELIQYVAKALKTYPHLFYGVDKIDLTGPWERRSVCEVFKQLGSTTMAAAEQSGDFDEIMAFEIEPRLGVTHPTFIYDYPASMAALAKLKADDNRLAERFELYIAGIELANGFSELTDPDEQRQRFNAVMEHRRQSKRTAHHQMGIEPSMQQIPEKFLSDLKHMPPAAGIAMGIDRLAMLFTDSPTIDNVVTFTPEAL
jgi:lysyl-tRNA synthetase class 2